MKQLTMILIGSILVGLGSGQALASSSFMPGQQYAYNRYSYAQQNALENNQERANYNYSGEVIYNYERPRESSRYQRYSYRSQQRQYERQRKQYQRQITREYRRVAPSFAEQSQPTGHRTFVFDPRQAAWAAYESDGSLIRTGAASGGKTYCPDIHRACRTPSGVYSVQRKGPANCKSSKFPIGEGGAPMPYCMFFHGGYAIHGSYQVPGYNASHGCIRVHPSDAEWLSDNFVRYGTKVVVKPY